MKRQHNLITQRHLPDMFTAVTSTAIQIAECHWVQIHAINVPMNCIAKELTEGKPVKPSSSNRIIAKTN